ncbi:hypothetical protein Taro_009716, partial [Colocasia esculenta]|nr:hypothetical protein [Colocasia esculenta]
LGEFGGGPLGADPSHPAPSPSPSPSPVEMKLSFSLSSSKSSSSRPLPAANGLTAANAREEEKQLQAAASTKSEFVTVFDPTVTLTTDAAASIAPLPNTDTWRAPTRMKNLLPPPSDPESSSSEVATRFVLDSSQPDAGGGTYGLVIRSKGGGAGSDGVGEGDSIGSPGREASNGRSELGFSAEQKFRDEIERLPEDRGMDEFQDISVEDFSRALLSGYGWKSGQGIGRNAKEDTKVREYKRWAGNGGLGFTPDPAVEKVRKKRREQFPPVPPPTDSTRTSVNESSAASGKKNEVLRVIAGEHAGLKAEVLKRSSHSGHAHGKVVLSLLSSGLEVSVGADMIAELGSAEEERCLRKLKEVEVREGGERRDVRRREDSMNGKWNHKSSSSSSSRHEEDGRSSSRNRQRESSERHQSSGDREAEPVSWLRSHIRVRIISRDFRGGRLYLKKGQVMDVVGPMTCDLSMDESGELLQGVEQEILETALPRRGGPVLVLFGRDKGRFGSLREKDTEKEMAVIQDADSHELFKVRLQQIAEYVGDPSVLGY